LDYTLPDTRTFCLECRSRADAEVKRCESTFAANARASPLLRLEPEQLDIIFLVG
jgi:hypothetical protein